MRKFLIAGALTVAMVTPALAANYFIVWNPQTKNCKVDSQRPGDPHDLVGNPSGYSNQSDAQSAMKGLISCKS